MPLDVYNATTTFPWLVTSYYRGTSSAGFPAIPGTQHIQSALSISCNVSEHIIHLLQALPIVHQAGQQNKTGYLLRIPGLYVYRYSDRIKVPRPRSSE